jgi:hypothetical protein
MLKEELKKRIDDADAIAAMMSTDGWKLLEALLREQLEAYKADVLFNCKSWDQYQEQRGKAWAINLLLTDIEDFQLQGAEASESITKLDN